MNRAFAFATIIPAASAAAASAYYYPREAGTS